jgi:predicted nucleotidyltransferase
MNILNSYTHEVLSAVNRAKVDYIVVGGYAVNYHGYIRSTGDIDLWIRPDNINKEKVIEALRLLEIEDDILEQIRQMDFRDYLVFSDGAEPFKVDFITHISGVSFEEAWKQRVTINIDDLEIPFIHLNHLILSKMSSKRGKDKVDIEYLQKITSQKKKRE